MVDRLLTRLLLLFRMQILTTTENADMLTDTTSALGKHCPFKADTGLDICIADRCMAWEFAGIVYGETSKSTNAEYDKHVGYCARVHPAPRVID